MRESSSVPAVVVSDVDSVSLRQAVAGYLAGFGETTRKAYGLDLRQWMQWCRSHDLRVFQARRAHIELYARWLEEQGRARATVARRLSTITGSLPVLRRGGADAEVTGDSYPSSQTQLRAERDRPRP